MLLVKLYFLKRVFLRKILNLKVLYTLLVVVISLVKKLLLRFLEGIIYDHFRTTQIEYLTRIKLSLSYLVAVLN